MTNNAKPWIDGPLVTTDLASHILTQRAITDAERFLNPTWPQDLHDPQLLPDGVVGSKRLWQAVHNNEKIGIIGDYDMDGTPGAVLLWQFLQLLGNDAHVVLPTREDGYGFSSRFVDQLTRQGVSLIITVDCGIRDFEAVGHAKAKKCDVIIIDHHECAASLPEAVAVINPKRADAIYPFRELCGTGVAYKFLQLMIHTAPRPLAKEIHNWLSWALDLVCLATLGDMVPLVDENRIFVSYGLKVIRKGKRLGLRRLMETIGLTLSTVGYNDVAYKIIPKLNASGRLESMDDVFKLLSSTNLLEVDSAIKRILTRDTQRQLLSKSIYQEAKQQFATSEPGSIIVLYNANWHPGVTGLVASRMAEEYQRPVGVFGSLDGALYRGSMRSNTGVALPELLQKASHMVEKYGGHNQAAGLSVRKEQISDFKQFLEALPLEMKSAEPLTTDGTVSIKHTAVELLEQLGTLAPWGIGHPEPLWSLCNVQLTDIRWIGQEGNHLKATIRDATTALDSICFGAEKYRHITPTDKLDLYGILEVNEFRGVKRPQLMVRGIYIK